MLEYEFIYNYYMRNQISILLVLISINTAVLSLDFNINISIQNTSQIFSHYIPYASVCEYVNQSSIIPGQNITTILTDDIIFQQNYQANQLAYWSPVKNGLLMEQKSQQLEYGYDGQVIYNSLIYTNHTRQLILYSLHNGVLTFNYTIPSMVNNGTINNIVVATNVLNFPVQVSNILTDCTGDRLLIAYIGYSQFVGYCTDTFQFFYWQQNNQSNAATQPFQTAQLIYPLKNITSAPQIYVGQIQNQQLPWRFTILDIFSNFYICNLTTTISCIDSLHAGDSVSSLINKLWGFSYQGQYMKLQDAVPILQRLKAKGYYIPGIIQSIYVDDFGFIYIQSFCNVNFVSYFISFDFNDLLLINSTFIGDIYAYNTDQILFRNNLQSPFVISKFILPMFQINDTYYPNKTYNLTIPCPYAIDYSINFHFKIMWSDIEFPKGTVNPILTPVDSINSPILSYSIEDYFQVIGPDYSMYISTQSDNIVGVIIDSASLAVDDYIYSLVRIIYTSSNKFSTTIAPRSFFYTVLNAVKYFDLASNSSVIVKNKPCGLTGPIYSQYIANYIFLFGQNISQGVCQCNTDLNKCNKVNQSEFMKFKYAFNYQWNEIVKDDTNIKKYIIGELNDQGLTVTIYRNNSIALSDAHTGSMLSIISLQNCTYDSVFGQIFVNQLQYPILVVFCQKSIFLHQYIVINNTLVWIRDIPIYGFETRRTSFFKGSNFAFLEVNPIQEYMSYSKCCVLRLDFQHFTVGVIDEVVPAQFVTFIYSIAGFDIAVYNNTDVSSLAQFVKIYFSSSFLALNQTTIENTVQTYSYSVIFESSYYNLGSVYSYNITFNLTSAQITYIGSLSPSLTLSPPQSLQIFGQTIYQGSSPFSFTQFCGPIMNAEFTHPSPQNQIDKIYSQTVLLQNMILGSEGQDYIQIITCETTSALFNIQSTIQSLLILVGVDTLFVYEKVVNETEIIPVTNITVGFKYCLYYIYKYLNSTAVEFLSDCMSPQLKLSTPVLTINYQNSNLTYTISILEQFGNFRSVIVLPGLNDQITPFVIGILQGPMNSLSGKLILCGSQELYCNTSLYQSSQDLFLVSFDVLAFTAKLQGSYQTSFAIMSVDNQQIEVWVGLTNQSSLLPVIEPNYTISYTSSINDTASVIIIVNSTFDNAIVIIGTIQSYIQLQLDFSTSTVTFLNKFIRYTNCDLFDSFVPQIVYDSNGNFQTLISECNQNQAIIKLKTLQVFNQTNPPIIYTAYIQIYNLYGPQCPTNVYYPINILPVSSLMDFKMFKKFYQGGKEYRLIYQQIKGILFNSNIYPQPYIYLQIIPLQQILVYPSIQLQLSNEYFSTSLTISINNQYSPLGTLGYVVVAITVAFNLITLIFILYWLFFEARKVFIKVKARVVKYQSETSQADESEQNRQKQQDFQFQKKTRFSEIELYEVKRVTNPIIQSPELSQK